jgi:hypothetical protein
VGDKVGLTALKVSNVIRSRRKWLEVRLPEMITSGVCGMRAQASKSIALLVIILKKKIGVFEVHLD